MTVVAIFPGKACSGKDTFAGRFMGTLNAKFASTLKHVIHTFKDDNTKLPKI
jgi:hypothetical protein